MVSFCGRLPLGEKWLGIIRRGLEARRSKHAQKKEFGKLRGMQHAVKYHKPNIYCEHEHSVAEPLYSALKSKIRRNRRQVAGLLVRWWQPGGWYHGPQAAGSSQIAGDIRYLPPVSRVDCPQITMQSLIKLAGGEGAIWSRQASVGSQEATGSSPTPPQPRGIVFASHI